MSCGNLQINRFHLIVFFTWQLSIYFAVQQLFPLFGNYVPKFHCGGRNDSAEFGWGRVALTLICALVPNWRFASVVSAVVLLPALPIINFIFPESPTWLENKCRFDEMRRSEAKIARIAGTPPLQNRKKHDQSRESEALANVYSVRDSFASRLIAKRTLILYLMWFIASLCSYTNDLNSPMLASDFYLNQILFAVMIVLSKVVIFALDTFVPQFSRRLLHQIPQACIVVCFTVLTVILIFAEAPVPVLVLNLAGAIYIEYTWDACYLCSAEGFPKEVRAIGVGTCSLLARAGALVAPQLAFLGKLWKPSPYLGVAILGLITLVLSWFFLPETKGSDLAVRERGISFVDDDDDDQKKQEEATEML